MPWAALDDGFHDDPRTIEAGPAAAGLYACITTHIARHLTDGRVSRKAVTRMLDGGGRAPLDALLTVGLLRADGDEYEAPDYLKANPTRAVAEDRKDKAAKRKAKGREKWEAKQRAERAAEQTPGATDAGHDPDDDPF